MVTSCFIGKEYRTVWVLCKALSLIHTSLGLLSHEEHRPSTTFFQCTRIWAVFQLHPKVTAFMHFCLGVSLPWVPWSFPLFLPMWIPCLSLPGDVAGWLPEGANPTPLLWICVSVWSLLVRKIGLLPFTSPHCLSSLATGWMRILHKHLSINVWSLWSVDWVILCVSDPQRSTDFTFVLKILNLVDFSISLELWTFLRIRKAVHALHILAFTFSNDRKEILGS